MTKRAILIRKSTVQSLPPSVKVSRPHHSGDVVSVDALNLGQLLAGQAGVEVDVVAVADGHDSTVTGQAEIKDILLIPSRTCFSAGISKIEILALAIPFMYH